MNTKYRPTTVYSDLWYQVIARPRYDKKLADSLRRAHNRLLQRRLKSAIAGEMGVEVSRIENGHATGLRVTYPQMETMR